MPMIWGMENSDVPGRAASTRRAFLSASAVTAVAAPLLSGTALAETDPALSRQAPDPGLRAMLRDVDPDRIKATVLKLVSFGTRHTASSQTDPNRGIGAATNWVFSQMQAIAATSSGRMTEQRQSFTQPVAPGADDDGSGVAVVLELARLDKAGHRSPAAFPQVLAAPQAGPAAPAARPRPDGTVRRMPPVWIGLTVAFASALVTNTAYSLEHDAAARLPPLSPRRPFRSVQILLRDRRWLIAFGAESAGWLMYVAALRLAPLSLVQAVVASGVAVLAFATARGHPSRLARREQLAVVLAIAGLVLLALSLVDTSESDQHPPVIGIVIWLAACGGGAALLIAIPPRFGRAASLGLAAGLLFADGDISAKLVGYGGWWLLALATLIVAYAVGTSVLQWAYQRGDALTAAGTATMVTNAVPIAAGFVLFGESLPHGARAVLQVAAFACLVVGAVALGHQQPPRPPNPPPRRAAVTSPIPRHPPGIG